MFLNCFGYLLRNDLKRFSITLSAFSLIVISLISLFEFITRSSLLSLVEIKLIGSVNSIFHMSNFLRLFMISSKYGSTF